MLTMTADGGFAASGPTVVAVDRQLGFTLAPGECARVPGEVAFTPGPAGLSRFAIKAASFDGQQLYRNQDDFLTELP